MPDRFDSRGWIVRRLMGQRPEVVPIPGHVPEVTWWFADQYGEGVAVAGMSLTRCLAIAEAESVRLQQ